MTIAARTRDGLRAWRVVRGTLGHHRRAIAGVVSLGLVLSFMPTLKSELEAAIIEQINRGLRSEGDADLADALGAHVHRSGSEATGAVDSVLQAIATFMFDDAPLWRALAIYAFLIALAYGLTVLTTTLRAGVTRSFFTQLRQAGIKKALNFESPGGSDDSNRPGKHATAIQIGSSNVAYGYSSWLEAGQHIFAIVVTLIFLAGKSPQFAIAIAGFIAVQIAITLWQARSMRHDRERFDEARNELVGRSQDIIGKRDVILAHERAEHYEDVLDRIAHDYGTLDKTLTRREEVYRGLTSAVADAGRMSILAVALVIAVTSGSSEISDIGDAYFLIAIYFRLLTPAQNLIANYADIRRSQSTSREFLELLNDRDRAKPTSEDGRTEAPQQPAVNAVEFRDVGFAYDKSAGHSDIDRSSFSLLAGRTNLIVGRSGAGKTTIARIILGFLAPDSGEVLIEGRQLTEWTPEGLRLRMSYVPQFDQIVNDTVRANFFLARPEDEELIRVLRAVSLPSGEASDQQIRELLGKQASDLSGGQQQRLALARLMVDDAAIVIMDEPLTGVDAFTFGEISEEVRGFFSDPRRTVVVISHRLAFAAYADHIVLMERQGRVIEEGSRDELVRGRGVFHDLYLAAVSELLPRATEQDLLR